MQIHFDPATGRVTIDGMRQHALARVYRIDFAMLNRTIIVRRDGSVSSRLEREPWQAWTREKTAGYLTEARSLADVSVSRERVNG